jgi:mediator of RNA polymerase II transcription subunit 6
MNATLSSSTPTLQLSYDMDNTVQDLSHLQWRAPEYLLSLPSGQLSSSEFAMDYFTMSPFFDKHSNNNQLRMQLMFSRGGIQGVNEQEELK